MTLEKLVQLGWYKAEPSSPKEIADLFSIVDRSQADLKQLSTHQVITLVLPTTDGKVVKIRRATAPEPIHREIYATLQIPSEVMKPVKTWHETST